MEDDFTLCKCRKRKGEGWRARLLAGCGPVLEGIEAAFFCQSCVRTAWKESFRKVKWTEFCMKFWWARWKRIGPSQTVFPRGRSCLRRGGATPAATSPASQCLLGQRWAVLSSCTWPLGTPSTKNWNSISPPVKGFVCVERQCPTCESHFKMRFEVWTNNVNDIQRDCQMLVIYFHFHINVSPPVMNWKLNKHISFN